MKTRITHSALLSLALLPLLAACGGGGGGDSAPTPTPTPAPTPAPAPAPAPPPPATVSEVLPAASMDWRTADALSLAVTVRQPDGLPAAGAALRVFSATRKSPMDGSTLEEPMPVVLLQSAITDAGGAVTLSLRLAAHVEELLVVATAGDLQAQQSFKPSTASQALILQLGR